MSDDLIDEAARLVIERQWASVSLIQRILRVGFARAWRILDELEERGIVASADGVKGRAVLVQRSPADTGRAER